MCLVLVSGRLIKLDKAGWHLAQQCTRSSSGTSGIIGRLCSAHASPNKLGYDASCVSAVSSPLSRIYPTGNHAIMVWYEYNQFPLYFLLKTCSLYLRPSEHFVGSATVDRRYLCAQIGSHDLGTLDLCLGVDVFVSGVLQVAYYYSQLAGDTHDLITPIAFHQNKIDLRE